MMSIRNLLGIKTAAEKEREKEMNYRMNVAKARRKADAVRRRMMQAKLQAVEYEKNGEHEKAVSLALQVAKNGKVVATAENQIRNCTEIHEMAKTQKTMKEIMDTCHQLSDGIIELADMEGAMKSQAENEEALARLIDTREQMEMFVEGIEDGQTTDVRNAEGEAALSALLAEQEEQKAPEKVKLPEIKLPENRDDPTENDWIAERHETLKALSSEA